MKITCVIPATKSYAYALEPCIRRIMASVYHARKRRDIEFQVVISTDKQSGSVIRKMKPDVTVIENDLIEDQARYKNASQILIANLFQTGFEYAISQNPDFCWTVESDVLVPHNALSCMLDMLQFDDGYYDVAFVTYPSHSGGMFLGGNGTDMNPIAEDFVMEERKVPEEVQARIKELTDILGKGPDEDTGEEEFKAMVQERGDLLRKCREEYPPKGNVFEMNAVKWRARGWFDHAFPAIGRGAVLETNWTGMGCNLLSAEALACSAFDGYDGGGTQDLFLNYRRWKANGLRMCVISHIVCEHVVHANDGDRKVHCFSHHEPNGECAGHLRVQHRPFYKFNGKDRYDPANTGKIIPPPKKEQSASAPKAPPAKPGK